MILTDGFGVSNNTKLLADGFAACGYFTVVPDLFEGDPFPDPRPETFNLQEWLKNGADGRGHLAIAVDPIVEKTVQWLRNEKGIKKVGAAGYCFGGKVRAPLHISRRQIHPLQYTIRYLRESFFDVGFVAHPTNTTTAEVSALRGPLSIAAAENDQIFPIEKRFESEELLRKNPAKPAWQISVYSGVGHGFAARGNRKITAESWAMDQAFHQAVSWMDEHLSAKS